MVPLVVLLPAGALLRRLGRHRLDRPARRGEGAGDRGSVARPAGAAARRDSVGAASSSRSAARSPRSPSSTVGQTLRPLSPLALLAPRRPDIGPQGLPVNRTAEGARVEQSARDPGYRLAVAGPRPYALGLAELRALPQHEATLPITCVEGWSASARWRGVRLRDLLDRAGAPAGASARVVSLERDGIYRESVVDSAHATDELTLLALELNGEPLALDHGFPVRLIAPNRPGVLQTKWVSRVEVL